MTAEDVLGMAKCSDPRCPCERHLREGSGAVRSVRTQQLVDGYAFTHCPLHPEGPPTLCVQACPDGAVLVQCWSGCSDYPIWAHILRRLNLL